MRLTVFFGNMQQQPQQQQYFARMLFAQCVSGAWYVIVMLIIPKIPNILVCA